MEVKRGSIYLYMKKAPATGQALGRERNGKSTHRGFARRR